MNPKLKQLHAILQLSPNGLKEKDIISILGVNKTQVTQLLTELDSFFSDTAVNIVYSENLVQLVVDTKYLPKNFNMNTPVVSIGTAAMEVLTIIAYSQPIDAASIEKIRGINSEQSIRNLLEKELISENRVKEKGIYYNRYITTKYFLQSAGIKSIKDLPKI